MKTKQTYNLPQLMYTVLMALALLWLTVSAPFVYDHQQKIVKQEKLTHTSNPKTDSGEEAANPFGNNTEEKVPDTNSFSEEYLHDHYKTDDVSFVRSQFRKFEKADTYIAFHGEILVPPPNQA